MNAVSATRRMHEAWLALALPVVAALIGCGRSDIAPPLPIAVQVVTLRPEQVASPLRYSATVRERQRVELSFKVPGTVASLLQVPGLDGCLRDVQEGDVVPAGAGQPLARLDDSDYQRRRNAAQGRLAQAQAKEQSILATLTAAQSEYRRVKAMWERRAIAEQAHDDSLGRKDAIEAELQAARCEVSSATVALQQADDDLRNCALCAPLPNGTLARKYVERHERVAANQPAEVREKIRQFDQNLLEAVVIVVVVALLLMEWRSALLVACSIPLTVAMTLGICQLLGIDLQQVSIAAMIIALGLLVDDPLHRAVIDSALVRLRPVLVTVLATVGGLIPLAIEGGPLWQPMCYVQIMGLLLATLVTKVIVPVLYVLFVENLGLIRWTPEHEPVTPAAPAFPQPIAEPQPIAPPSA